jgi:hypothetical protein
MADKRHSQAAEAPHPSKLRSRRAVRSAADRRQSVFATIIRNPIQVYAAASK